ncbi:cupin domain-containing protein [Paenibacillus sp. DYY-L-2]|uniref:cupin domain-containing protein n=1 Tax=Paenibacillus sp. DYY-L-2 TaxID=3447013 RepID=UPI003F4FF3C4
MKISKKSAEHYLWGDQCDGWHLVKGEDLSIIHERMPANTSEIKHYHERARQFFFVLSGAATMIMEDQEITIHPQEGLEIPPLVPHQMCNKSGEAVEFLVISQPNSRGDRIAVN